MKETKKVRLTNIELLRIIAMIMIVIDHIVCHCINVQLSGGNSVIKITSYLFNKPLFYKKLFLLSDIMSWGPIGNALFLIISGYFIINSKKQMDIKKIATKLLSQLGFACLMLVIVSTLIYISTITEKYVQLININFFNSMSWYVGYYFLIMLMAYLFLNKYLRKLNKKQYSTYLIILFALTQFGWITQLVNGITNDFSTLLSGIFFYSWGGYIYKYKPFNKVKLIVPLTIIIICNLLIFISTYNITATRIENYLLNPTGRFTQSIMTFENNNILVLIMSICIFEIFTRLKIPNIKFINYIASGTFMVYLIHDNALFYSLWGMINWIKVLYDNPLQFVALLMGIGLLTFLAGIMVYLLYNLVTKIYLKYKRLFINE